MTFLKYISIFTDYGTRLLGHYYAIERQARIIYLFTELNYTS